MLVFYAVGAAAFDKQCILCLIVYFLVKLTEMWFNTNNMSYFSLKDKSRL